MDVLETIVRIYSFRSGIISKALDMLLGKCVFMWRSAASDAGGRSCCLTKYAGDDGNPVLPGAGVIVENTRMLGFCSYEDAGYLFDFNSSNLTDFF
jgi:hypothetical protein